jgi:hypothetical protein
MNYSLIKEGIRIRKPRKGIGKTVHNTNKDDVIPLVRLKPPPYHLKPDASYVLVDVLGALGRSIDLRMAEKGARNLIFLSGSVKITPAVETMCKAVNC